MWKVTIVNGYDKFSVVDDGFTDLVSRAKYMLEHMIRKEGAHFTVEIVEEEVNENGDEE